jgi:hypothetical protein
MNLSKLDSVPLRQASLCLDCDMITAAHTCCCACGSRAIMSLAKILNEGECADPVLGKQSEASSLSASCAHQARGLSGAVAHRGGRFRERGFPRALVALNRRGEDRAQQLTNTPCRRADHREH